MEVQDRMRNWYGHMVRREDHCVGRMTMEKVQGRQKRGRPKRRWLDRVRCDIKEKGLSGCDIKEKGLSGRECTTEQHNI